MNIDKVVPAAQKMLKEIIEIQLSGDVTKAEKFVNDNFVWDENLERVANELKKADSELNGQVVSPLADKLYAE